MTNNTDFSKLDGGYIRASEDCPFKDGCAIALAKCCYRGEAYNCKFSCAIARGFDLVDSIKMRNLSTNKN